MIEALAEKIAKFVCTYTKADNQMLDVYKYGIEVTISTLLNIVCVIIVSIMMSDIKSGIIFIAVHFIIKPFVGGYHAKTYLMCNVMFTLAFLVVYFSNCLFLQIKEAEIQKVIIESLFLLSLIPIIAFAPVHNQNKPLSEKEAKKYRIIGITMSVFLGFIGLILFLFDMYIGSLITITIVVISLMMLIDKKSNQGGEKI